MSEGGQFLLSLDSLGAWVEGNTDAAVKTAAASISKAMVALTAKQEKAVRDAVPTAHVIELPNANHFVFLSNETDVLRYMSTFLAELH